MNLTRRSPEETIQYLERTLSSHKDQMMIHPTEEKKRTIELLEQLLAKQKEELEGGVE